MPTNQNLRALRDSRKVTVREVELESRRIAEANRIAQYASTPDDWFTIVGVVGNTQDEGLDVNPRPSMFYPQFDGDPTSGGLVIRAQSGVAALTVPAIRAVRRLAPMASVAR